MKLISGGGEIQDLQIVRIDSDRTDLVEAYVNLSQHYEAEFSPLTGKTPDGLGFYEYTTLDDGHSGFLAFQDGCPIAFLVLQSIEGRFDVAEFYVIPTVRKRKVGQTLAHTIFDHFPGQWQVRQIEGADRAYAFWLNVIHEYTRGDFVDTQELDSHWGKVRIQLFSTPAHKA